MSFILLFSEHVFKNLTFFLKMYTYLIKSAAILSSYIVKKYDIGH